MAVRNYCIERKKCSDGLDLVIIPASYGDDSKDSLAAPRNGEFQDSLVVYEANNHIYIYTHDGVPTKITGREAMSVSFDELTGRPKYGGVEMTSVTDIPSIESVVESINGKTGDVILTAEDIGALPNTPETLAPYAKKEELSGVAFTGNYDDLNNEPQDFNEDEWDSLWDI